VGRSGEGVRGAVGGHAQAEACSQFAIHEVALPWLVRAAKECDSR